MQEAFEKFVIAVISSAAQVNTGREGQNLNFTISLHIHKILSSLGRLLFLSSSFFYFLSSIFYFLFFLILPSFSFYNWDSGLMVNG